MKYDIESYYEVPEVHLPYLAAIGINPIEYPFDRKLTAYYVALKDGTLEKYKSTLSHCRDLKNKKLYDWKNKVHIPEFECADGFKPFMYTPPTDNGGLGSPLMHNSFEDDATFYRDYETFDEQYYRLTMISKIPGWEYLEPGEFNLPEAPKWTRDINDQMGTPWSVPFKKARFKGDKLSKNHNKIVKLLDKYKTYGNVIGEPDIPCVYTKRDKLKKRKDLDEFLNKYGGYLMLVPELFDKLYLLFWVWPKKFRHYPGTLEDKAEILINYYVYGKKRYKKEGDFLKLFDKRYKELVSG